ncbi:succinate dehydrogenase, hydrophobic membrane anchor protein [Immundisolibacter sp.]
MTQFRSPRALARGYGASGAGTSAFFWERLTAATLIVLGAVLLAQFVCLSAGGVSLDEVRAWLATPATGGLMLVFFLIAMINAYLCSRVLIEDYIHVPAQSLLALIGLLVVVVGLGSVAAVSVLRVMFGQ